MISVESLKMEFAAKPLFENVSFVVNNKDRIALVGKNGAGKSTLLKIIAGLQNPTQGAVNVQNGVTIGYLPQIMNLADDSTVRQETEKAFENIQNIKKRIDELNKELQQRQDYESEEYMKLLECFSHETERFNILGGLTSQAELERTLLGLGFKQADLDRTTSEFSGGWRMRIELAKILLQRPDLLLLDEPTNHLDIGSIQWLEQFIAQRANAVMIVSHDKAFINNVTSRTIEITCGHINDYKVGYDQYVILRDERREQQLRAYENQQKEIAETKAFIERFRYKPTKSNQVQSRVKALEKMQVVEIDEIDTSRLNLKFPKCARSGDFPIITDQLTKKYGNHLVFQDVNITVKRGEKVALVGNNGEGKSTFVKCIMEETDYDGMLKVGHNVQIGYFAQNQAQMLDPDITVFDTIDHAATGDMRTKVRDILGAFMFGGENSDKLVKVLSGGERSRLAMIQLLLQPVNFLILDEPTNHLDLQSKEVLKKAVKDFDGTVIVVSHDRDFLDGLVTRVYEFADGKVREHIGGIYDFLETKRREQEGMTGLDNNVNDRQATNSTDNTQATPTNNNRGATTYEQQKEQAKIRRKAEKRLKEAEERVEDIETQIKTLEDKMASNTADQQLFKKYAQLRQLLNQAEEEWTIAATQLEELE